MRAGQFAPFGHMYFFTCGVFVNQIVTDFTQFNFSVQVIGMNRHVVYCVHDVRLCRQSFQIRFEVGGYDAARFEQGHFYARRGQGRIQHSVIQHFRQRRDVLRLVVAPFLYGVGAAPGPLRLVDRRDIADGNSCGDEVFGNRHQIIRVIVKSVLSKDAIKTRYHLSSYMTSIYALKTLTQLTTKTTLFIFVSPRRVHCLTCLFPPPIDSLKSINNYYSFSSILNTKYYIICLLFCKSFLKF